MVEAVDHNAGVPSLRVQSHGARYGLRRSLGCHTNLLLYAISRVTNISNVVICSHTCRVPLWCSL